MEAGIASVYVHGSHSLKIKVHPRDGFPIDEVISKTVSIDDAGEALASWATDPKGIIKIMVNFNNQDT
jgi:hypothetical protein